MTHEPYDVLSETDCTCNFCVTGERDGLGHDDDDDCTWCGGEGWESCDDPIQCFATHVYDEHPCTACAGTGLRSKQTVF